VIYVVYLVVALAGAGIQLWRHPEARKPAAAIDTALLWWIVVTIGAAGIVGALFHLIDGPGVAREIGFTRGDGGFQTEVGFGDLALEVAAVLCIWFRAATGWHRRCGLHALPGGSAGGFRPGRAPAPGNAST